MLTLFFFRISLLNEKNNLKMMKSSLIVIELLNLMDRSNESFDVEKISFSDHYENKKDHDDLIESILKSFIKFTC